MCKRIIAVKGSKDPLDFFTDCIVSAFIQLGFEVYVHDISNESSSNQGLMQFLNLPIDFVIGYNNIGFLITVNGRCLWDILGIYYINIIVDSPVFYTEVLDNFAFSKSVFLCPDNDHVYYIDRMWPDTYAAFLPHAAWNYKPVSPCMERTGHPILVLTIRISYIMAEFRLLKFLTKCLTAK